MASRFNRSNRSYMTYVFCLVVFCSGGAALAQTPDCDALKTRLERAETRLNDWPALARYHEANKNTPPPAKNEQRVVWRVAC